MVLIVLGCVLVPVSLVAVWTHNEISDTDHFVATAGPLIDDPAVQEALTNRVTTTVSQYVDVQDLADQSIAALARGLLVGAVPAAGAPAAAASFDIIVGFLRTSGRAVLVLALVVALGAFLAGSSASAISVRHGAKDLLGRIRGGPSATGPVGLWVRAHVRGLRIGAVALAALLFVFLPQPTGVAILLIAAGLLLVLAVIEFLARPGQAPAQEPPPVAAGEVTAAQSPT